RAGPRRGRGGGAVLGGRSEPARRLAGTARRAVTVNAVSPGTAAARWQGQVRAILRGKVAAISQTVRVSRPAHHARAVHSSEPGVPPFRSAREVSMTGVIGWCSAIGRSQAGMVSTRAKPLDT